MYSAHEYCLSKSNVQDDSDSINIDYGVQNPASTHAVYRDLDHDALDRFFRMSCAQTSMTKSPVLTVVSVALKSNQLVKSFPATLTLDL